MNAEPPAVVQPAPETEAQYRARVDVRLTTIEEHLEYIRTAIDILLKVKALDE